MAAHNEGVTVNTKAKIARLRAMAEELEAQAWDVRGKAAVFEYALIEAMHNFGFAISCRERAAGYIIDAEKAEAGPNLAFTQNTTEG